MVTWIVFHAFVVKLAMGTQFPCQFQPPERPSCPNTWRPESVLPDGIQTWNVTTAPAVVLGVAICADGPHRNPGQFLDFGVGILGMISGGAVRSTGESPTPVFRRA